MRLDRFLAECGIGTRTEVKKIISKGRVSVNGIVNTDASFQVNESSDSVLLDSEPVKFTEFEYWMLNKPSGIESVSRKNTAKRGERIPVGEERFAVDLIKDSVKTDLFPAGRLDKDTEGLLLITNDGALSHRLLSPKKHVEKTYYTELSGSLKESDRQMLENGVDIGDDKPTLPCRINILSDNSCLITITEGRYHQVKRMFLKAGLIVTYLKRITFGPLVLDPELEPGQYRPLTPEELSEL